MAADDDFGTFLNQASTNLANFVSFVNGIRASTWTKSTDLLATIPTGATSVVVLHGLGRANNGAAIVGQTDASRQASVDLTQDPSTLTVRISAAVAYPFTVKLRVY